MKNTEVVKQYIAKWLLKEKQEKIREAMLVDLKNREAKCKCGYQFGPGSIIESDGVYGPFYCSNCHIMIINMRFDYGN